MPSPQADSPPALIVQTVLLYTSSPSSFLSVSFSLPVCLLLCYCCFILLPYLSHSVYRLLSSLSRLCPSSFPICLFVFLFSVFSSYLVLLPSRGLLLRLSSSSSLPVLSSSLLVYLLFSACLSPRLCLSFFYFSFSLSHSLSVIPPFISFFFFT